MNMEECKMKNLKIAGHEPELSWKVKRLKGKQLFISPYSAALASGYLFEFLWLDDLKGLQREFIDKILYNFL
jgi:hypothetical protein